MKKFLMFLTISLVSILLLPSKIYAKNVFPTIPISSDLPHMITMRDTGMNSTREIQLTYCKDSSYHLKSKNGSNTEFAICVDENGTSKGYAYRRALVYTGSDITIELIVNDRADFSSYSWTNEVQANWYGTQIKYDNELHRLAYIKDYSFSGIYELPNSLNAIIYTNTDIYNSAFDTIVFNKNLIENDTNEMRCDLASDYKYLGRVYGLNSFDFVVEKDIQFPDIENEPYVDSNFNGVFQFTFSDKLDPLPTAQDFTITYTNDNNVPLIGDYDLTCEKNSCFVEYHYSTTSVELVHAKLTFYVTYNGLNTLPAVDIRACPLVGVNNYYTYSNSATGTGDILNDLNNNNINLGVLANVSSWLPTGPIDSILTLPVKMLQSLTDSLRGTCSPINVNLPYVNRNISLPCINSFYNNIGAGTFFNWVGVMVSALMLLEYFVFLYNWLNNVFRLNEKNLKVWGTTGKGGYY